MSISDKIIELRIILTNCCDGFSDNGKDTILSTKLKVLFMLEQSDCCPCDFIDKLCMAKSNVANLLKKMNSENLIESYKTTFNSKNVHYRIAPLGKQLISEYKQTMYKHFIDKLDCDENDLSKITNDLINILKGK